MRNSRYMLLFALLFFGAQGPALSQLPPIPGRLVDGDWTYGVPAGWTTAGNAKLDFGTLYGGVPNGQRAAVLWSRNRLSENEFGTLMQTISANAYRGRRARLSAMLSAEQNLADGRIALWMRVNDQSGKVAAFDNMETRPIPVGVGWERYEIVLDVPSEAASISFGALLAGGGKRCCLGRVAVSDFRLEVVGDDINVTAAPVETLPDAPVNADFSQP